ncbi:B-cell CLL/lymphoma 7 protein family member A-like isoform X1 [Dendronephthya gigantea]|uniref:B-cell CLL/lymphoma 7 protein family member A-like isoform X1 n=1 Tax=Dendronephthya gigantea TaxID=151771 RepID=UPI00106B5355|nr:B-cell CLL/lymphoma 7 protein family member A-like isoform X1 [Dendronephthya gigantea]
MNRSGVSRLETRSTRANKEELVKRVMMTVERVRKWEKKWVNSDAEGCTLKIYKWVPVSDDDLKKVKTIQNNLPPGITDSMSDTSSPLPADDSSLPGKDSEQAQQNELKNSSENAKGTGLNARQIGKILQDEGEDSNHAPSVASEDSTSIMFHLGINVVGENEDSRQSFQSITDSESSETNARKSPASEPSHIVINDTSGLFSITAPSGDANTSNKSDEPPAKKAKESTS